MPSYSQVLGDARQQASIERMMYDFWSNDGGLFIVRSSPHLIVLNRNRSLNLIRGYLRGRFPLPRLRLILEVSSESSPTTNAPSVITSRRQSPRTAGNVTAVDDLAPEEDLASPCRTTRAAGRFVPVVSDDDSDTAPADDHPGRTSRRRSTRLSTMTAARLLPVTSEEHSNGPPASGTSDRSRYSLRSSSAGIVSDVQSQSDSDVANDFKYGIGHPVSKHFPGHGTFLGKVSMLPTGTRRFYRIIYSDGDEEEMRQSQIDKLLRKEQEQLEKNKKQSLKEEVKKKSIPHKKKQQPKKKILAKDIYLEMPWPASAGDLQLTSDAIARLRNVGCGSHAWLSIARRVFNEFNQKKDAVTKKRRKESLNPIVPLYWIKGMKRRAEIERTAIKFHEKVIAPLRRKSSRRKLGMPTSPRDLWGNWFPRDKHRPENAGKVMIKTPGVNDDLVERAEIWMRKELGVVSCATVLQPPRRKRRYSYRSLTHMYGSGLGMQYNFKKAGAMTLFSLLCVVLDRAPESIEEWLAVRGIGLKCGHICMFEGLGEVTGIGVDIHIWRMCTYFGWTSKMDEYNCEKSTRELESWFPHRFWGEMNELYAGLGQLLQSQHKELVKRKVMKRALSTKDKEVIRLAKILLSIPEYK